MDVCPCFSCPSTKNHSSKKIQGCSPSFSSPANVAVAPCLYFVQTKSKWYRHDRLRCTQQLFLKFLFSFQFYHSFFFSLHLVTSLECSLSKQYDTNWRKNEAATRLKGPGERYECLPINHAFQNSHHLYTLIDRHPL